MRIAAVVIIAVMLPGLTRSAGFAAWQRGGEAQLPLYTYTIVRSYPHDRDAFTQGLEYRDGVFYEGTGLNGRSSIRRVKIDTGEVLQKRDVPAQYFGEGITLHGSDLFELTWQSGVALVYDGKTFAPKGTHKYTGEGWGLTQNKTALHMSDGTEFLRVLDPEAYTERKRVRVTGAGALLKNLTELEYVKGEVFANIWQPDFVARIDPS